MSDFLHALSNATADRHITEQEANDLVTESAPKTDADVARLAQAVDRIRLSNRSSPDHYTIDDSKTYQRLIDYVHARQNPGPPLPPPPRSKDTQILRCMAGAAIGSIVGIAAGDLLGGTLATKMIIGVTTGVVAAPLGCYIATR